jgi:hypothetical protein
MTMLSALHLRMPQEHSPMLKMSILLRSTQKHERLTIGGKLFATKNRSRRNAEVFFKPLDCEDLLPGVIAGITSIEDGDQEVFVLSIQPRKPAPACIKNPFARYPDFGAQLWSTEFEEEIMCIPATQPICHSESRMWVKGVVVLKAITSVGLQTCQFARDLQYPFR